MVFTVENIPYPLIMGLSVNYNTHCFNKNLIFEFVQKLEENKFDYIQCNVSMQEINEKKKFLKMDTNNESNPVYLDDYLLFSYEWRDKFATKLHQTDVESLQENMDIIMGDIEFSNHINSRHLTIPLTNNMRENIPKLTKLIKSYNPENYGKDILIEIPLDSLGENLKFWNKLSSMVGYQDNLSVLLKVECDLPDIAIIKQWCSHNLKAVKLPLSIFLSNKNGYPVLSKLHQEYIKLFMFHRVEIILEDDSNKYVVDPESLNKIKDFQLYIYHLFKTHKVFDNKSFQVFNYLDFFQVPLQPLRDNLQSQTYEVFEDDSPKYDQYFFAIKKALQNFKTFGLINLDNIKASKQNDLKGNLGLFPTDQERTLILSVVGAGRGPLVRKAIEACKEANVNYKIYVVEKNKNAYNTLMYLKLNEPEIFNEKVFLQWGDMRSWEPKEKLDIVISELLGSFGDNESSPECLINIQKYLSLDSIMIPHSYDSYIRPVSCPVVWKNIKKLKDYSYEIPYVILLNKVYYPIENDEKCFEFTHPVKHSDLSQNKNIQFKFNENLIIHGFVGYFRAVLYDEVILSTRPIDHTEGLMSWFPMYFPINFPLEIKLGETLEITLWRENDSKKVWYEWCCIVKNNNSENFYCAGIHNSNAKSYSILL